MFAILGFLPGAFFLIIIFVILSLTMKHTNILKLYLAIASLIGLIGIIIGFGTVGYTAIKKVVITDQEYVIGSNPYEVKQCEDPVFNDVKKENIKRTPEEIEKCKADATERMIAQRHYNDKDSMVSGVVWGSMLLLVFLVHFPFFIKARKEDD
jgi:disulfide bond formation protein DsbB